MTQNSNNQSLSAKNIESFAKGSIISTAIFIGLLIILHFIKPEIDPSWRFISEYAIGNHGWLMNIAFFSLSVSYVTLFAAIKAGTQLSITGKIGAFLLLVSAVGLALAGIFSTDPITATENERTVGGSIHSLGGALGITMPFAAILIYLALRKNEIWSKKIRPIFFATIVSTIGFLFSFVSLAIALSQSNGKFGPDVMVGWPNRVEVIGYCVWLFVIASEVLHMNTNLEANTQTKPIH